MGHRNRSHKGRARGANTHGASADDLFELALRGNDPSRRSSFDPATDRKTLQLCRQVQRALMLALAGECGDDLLIDVSLDSVEPAGGAGQLLVRVIVPQSVSVLEVLSRSNDRAGKLRGLVAGSICRKRVPMLSFVAVAAMPGGQP